MTVVALMSPSISQVSPQVVTAGTPSVTVTVQGANFQSQAALTVNGTAVPTTVVNSTTLAANISGSPLAQPAVAQLQVKNSDGAASNQVPLTVTTAPDSQNSLSITTTQLPSAQVGVSYKVSLGASGGSQPYKWSLSSGSLPSGLTMSNGGVISGSPSISGTFAFGVTVTDAESKAQSKTVTFSIVVTPAQSAPSALSISSAGLSSGRVGSTYAVSLSVSGGTPGYTWSVASGSLPAGLALSSAGVISGSPIASGTWTFTVAVKDSGSPVQKASAIESIAVNPGTSKLTITTTSLAAGKGGSSYNASVSASGGTPGYTWSIASGSLPAGLSLSSTGVISGMPTGSGTSTFMVGVHDNGSPVQTASGQESITVNAAPSTLTITSTSLAAGKNGSSYSTTLSATGGTPGYTWSIASGSLPAGLALSGAGQISGTPTGSGTATFTVAVQDSASPAQKATASESITVGTTPSTLTIATTSLAAGKNGSSYSTTLSATGGTPGYTWSIASGSLPAGLTLSGAGQISGTPTGSGTATFTVAVQDSASPAQKASAQESITVSAASSTLTITSTSLGAAQTGNSYSTTLSASGGTPGYTWTVSAGTLPAGLTMSSAGVISGTPTATGSSNFTVTVTDSSSTAQTASASESIAVAVPQLTITTSFLSSGTSGAAYTATLGANGGAPAYAWSLASGNLPAGLTLSSTGVISGTPTAAANSTFTVSVSDSQSPAATATATETINVGNATNPNPGTAQLYVFPQTAVAVRGSYQTVTAIVNGVNDKTVTWSTTGGTIVGTNPCVANEPCTVAVYSGSSGSYTLTATSNANSSVTASSTITFAASPTPRTDHPRFLMTSDELVALRAKATSANPMYQAINSLGSRYYASDSSIWTFSTWDGTTCTGGSAAASDQSANYKEVDAWWMVLVSLLDSSSATRNQYGCAARDVFMTNIGYVLNGEINLNSGNRWSDSATQFALTADYLMGGNYLSPSDLVTVHQYIAQLEYQQINDVYNGALAVVGNYNSPAQFQTSSEWSETGMRAMGNNYTQARILIMAAAALTFNDNTTDDPPLTNTCSATRYQVCPDGTAGSLHAYWNYVTGGMLYKDWANLEDPTVVQQAYNSTFNNMPSIPACTAPWGTGIGCFGAGRGGESSEGTIYGNSVGAFRRGLNAIHTAGYDDPVLYGPQMSLGTMSYWDLRYVADLTILTGLSGAPSDKARWNFLTDGDSNSYYTYAGSYLTEASLLSADSLAGRTDRSSGLEWTVLNTAFGMADGQTGGCTSYCGIDGELGNDFASSVALDLFLALPANDPVSNNPPADPRPSMPTDWYDAGNQHIVVRDGGWTTGANTIFSYYCTNTQIDHEHQFCGRFDLYSDGEYITKGRMEFNDYNDEMSTSLNQNITSLIQYPGQNWCTPNPWCSFNQGAEEGGQFWHGYQAGLATLYHAELPGYVAAIAEDHNAYNGGNGGYGRFNGVTAASRSLVYLRGTNAIVYYDRGETGSNAWEKANYIVSTGTPSVSGNTASWSTRSGNQKVYWTTLEPSGTAPQLDTAYNDADSPNDWEIYGRVKADAGSVASACFLSVLDWGSAGFAGISANTVVSTSGNNFEGALLGSSLVMFMHDWPAAFTGITYAASGATTHYISDLTPNTSYTLSGAGAPTTATTDNAGLLVFTAAGSGNITIAP
jgi:hypothetical protein